MSVSPNLFNLQMLTIRSDFDAGAIEVVRADALNDIVLRLRNDSHAALAQWFYFSLELSVKQHNEMMLNVSKRTDDLAFKNTVNLTLDNAGESAYPEGWRDYRMCASYDNQTWFRIETDYDGEKLRARMNWASAQTTRTIYFAYFEPYSWQRHVAFISKAQTSAHCKVRTLGQSIEGRAIDALIIGDEKAQHKIWVIARQHPGETMAEWFAEGMVEALLDAHNVTAQALLQRAVFYVVPNMNPDGAVHGNLRTNAAGANLNREWMTPSLNKSPEVLCVKNAIHQTGCDLFLDVHGDEVLPYNFVSGCEMLASITPAQVARQRVFVEAFKQASPAFQDVQGYAAARYRADVLTLASKYVGHTFACVSLTLELPFKDDANHPNLNTGWNGARSKALGAAVLNAMLVTLKTPS